MDSYVLKLPNVYLDIDTNNIVDYVKDIIFKYGFIGANGSMKVDIFNNINYGTIVSIDRDVFCNYCLDTKIIVHIDSIFLYEIEYFDIKRINGYGSVYYYKGKYYIDIYSDLDNIYLSEYGIVIYGDYVFDIINNGIKLFCGYFFDIP